MKTKALSPVIATVLLIAIVIVIGLIVFLWFRNISEEAITKFDGTNVKLVCEDVLFEATYSDPTIYISNTGNVPIYKMKAQLSGTGEHSTEFIGADGTWPEIGLGQGAVYSGQVTSADEILLIPVLLGSSDTGDKTHTCDKRHGYSVI